MPSGPFAFAAPKICLFILEISSIQAFLLRKPLRKRGFFSHCLQDGVSTGFCFQDGGREREEGFLRSSFDVSCTKALGVRFWEQDLLLHPPWSWDLGRLSIPAGLTSPSSPRWEQGGLCFSHPSTSSISSEEAG